MDRRSFLRTTGIGAAGISLSQPVLANANTGTIDRQFQISLKQDAIGANLKLNELLTMAKKVGYEAVAVPSEWLVNKSEKELDTLNGRMKSMGLTYGSAGMPVQFRESMDRFKQDLQNLPRHATAMQVAGIKRVGTWIMPSNDQLTYEENMDLHVTRLRECAKIYADHNIRLGLEYVGTKRLHDKAAYGFVRTGRQLKAMIDAIDVKGLGVVLDSFHWYTSGEKAEHLNIWTNEDIVAVDLNDADRQLSRTEQVDQNRELPGATGVIDIAAFMGFLEKVNYDGPVRAEPFNATLNAMRDELSIQATYDAIMKVV